MARKKAKALPQPDPEMFTIYGNIAQETEDAILLLCEDEQYWLPKSQIEYCGERGEDVEVTLPDWLAEDKGLADGQGMPQTVPPAPENVSPPAQPEIFTFKADVEHVYAEKYVLLVVNGEKTASLEFDKADVSYEGQDVTDLQEGYTGMEFTVPYTLAVEKHLPEFLEVAPVPTQATPPAESDDKGNNETPTTGRRSFGDNVKWIKEEKVTVSQPLSDAEKARYAEDMAALDKEIEELEDERAAISSRLKKQIDAKEQERREMSAHVNDGELRTFTCDCLKDYASGEMVWTEAYPPYAEVQRRKMTKEEMQPSLLEYSEKNRQASQTLDAAPANQPDPEDAEAGTIPTLSGTVTLHGRLEDICDDTITIAFTDSEGEEMAFGLPLAGVSYEGNLEVGDSADFTMPLALALSEGIVDAAENGEGLPEAEPERSCGTCARIHATPADGEESPCTDCGQDPDLPNWIPDEYQIPAVSQGAQTAEAVQ